MIIDSIENINLYKEIPSLAADFILNLDTNITMGKHVLSENIYANVEKYSTKLLKDAKFETHDNYIDIQLLLSGHENVAIAKREILTVKEQYDKSRDITFYSDNVSTFPCVTLDGTNFVMIFPHEGHAPQVSVEENVETVLKVVVKIKI